MRQRLFVNKVTGLSKLTIKTPKWRHLRSFGVFIVNFERPATLLKKSLWHWCFPANFKKISKNTFFTEHLWATASAFPNVRAPIFTFASKRFLHRIWWLHKFNRYKKRLPKTKSKKSSHHEIWRVSGTFDYKSFDEKFLLKYWYGH